MARTPRLALLATTLLATALLVSSTLGCATADPAVLATRLADSGRSEADRARDAGRKPAEVVAFVGIGSGMEVMDLIAASGWYTEVLSVAVGPQGRVYAQNNDFVLKFRDGANDKALTARLAGGRLPNVKRVDSELADVPVPDGSLDAAFTALNFHDVYNARGEEVALAFLSVVERKLKPGGILGIVDHDGSAGAGSAEQNADLHRIEKRLVLEVIAKSGFVLEAESDVLANPEDDHSQNVFTPGLRGTTDRFVLKLRKP